MILSSVPWPDAGFSPVRLIGGELGQESMIAKPKKKTSFLAGRLFLSCSSCRKYQFIVSLELGRRKSVELAFFLLFSQTRRFLEYLIFLEDAGSVVI